MLAALLERRRPTAFATWLADASVASGAALNRVAFEIAFASAGRRFGTAAIGSGATVAGAGGRTWSIAGWGLDEAARALLVLGGVAALPAADQPAFVDGLYRAGALRERQAVLRALALLPDPARFCAIALDACRASAQPVFEAIACENPYPAAWFAEPSFNQMALKAVFTGVAVARILDLETRRTADLARMAADYAAERRAAGRPVPTDLALLAAP
ncbi:MAG: EboA domain-containing protein [Deltaproteobacteria bacterium]|nr:EboA domain-containing protein [Deltaproteobacteria bacterium]